MKNLVKNAITINLYYVSVKIMMLAAAFANNSFFLYKGRTIDNIREP